MWPIVLEVRFGWASCHRNKIVFLKEIGTRVQGEPEVLISTVPRASLQSDEVTGRSVPQSGYVLA